MELGKRRRLARILNPQDHRTVIVPLDHGMTVGPIQGIQDIDGTVAELSRGGADAVIMHKGLARSVESCGGVSRTALIVHLSASTSLAPGGNTKGIVGTVEEALRLDADAVSIHVNIGDDNERQMLEDAGRIADDCDRWGMPLLMMLYARGPRIKDSFAPDMVAHCARVGAELGADLVKVSYTGSVDSFADVVRACSVPVLIAGGERMDSTCAILQMVHDAMLAGAAGLSIGRNVFQHPQRRELVAALRAMVHNHSGVDEAMGLLAGHPVSMAA